MIIDDEFLEKLKVGDEIKIKVVETEEPYQCNRCIFRFCDCHEIGCYNPYDKSKKGLCYEIQD